eukprot:scaffold213616_cov17-Prasinocladus_malaysianus.AAC.1
MCHAQTVNLAGGDRPEDDGPQASADSAMPASVMPGNIGLEVEHEVPAGDEDQRTTEEADYPSGREPKCQIKLKAKRI